MSIEMAVAASMEERRFGEAVFSVSPRVWANLTKEFNQKLTLLPRSPPPPHRHEFQFWLTGGVVRLRLREAAHG